jgi:ATP-binding cassette subfamily C protein
MSELKTDMVNLTGKLQQSNANQPIELNDPQQVWVVQSGSIAIFVVTIDRDQIAGQRQYLCTIDPGEAMFGAVATSHQLLAVPFGTAEVLALDPNCWQDLCHQQDPRIHTWLTSWLGHLAPILATQPLPATAVQANNAAHYSLVDRQTLQVTEMCWVEMQSGTACWQGITEIPLTKLYHSPLRSGYPRSGMSKLLLVPSPRFPPPPYLLVWHGFTPVCCRASNSVTNASNKSIDPA